MSCMRGQEKAPLMSIRGVTKAFGRNAVLKGIDLDVRAGEVAALIGGNGAGKSTLMKIIMGIYELDEGEIRMDGQPVRLGKPSSSLMNGIYLVPQEPMLFPNMTVEENILMGFEGKRGELHKQLCDLMGSLHWSIELNRKADSLSIAEQQLVELLRGLMRHSRLLILDEPTSSLTFNEVESLFGIVRDLKSKGMGVIYITHRLSEVFELADRVMIMRDGVITLNGPVGDFTRDMLVMGLLPPDSVMCSIKNKQNCQRDPHAEPALRIEKLSGFGFSDISLAVYPGEVLGLAGVVGAGRTEFATTVFGRDIVKSGKVYLNGKDITGLSTRQILSEGLNYVAEDRFLHGVFGLADVTANTTAACMDRLSRVFTNYREERRITDEFIRAFRTKVTGRDQQLGSLSGGNQQKVVIARSLSTRPRVLILDEPTRGIDAAARGDVYAIIEQLKQQGLAILLISSDMEEIVELSDRAVTMYRGRINREFSGSGICQDDLMAAAFGIVKGEGESA